MRTALLLVVALTACRSKPQPTDLLIDRNWIDRMPTNETDKLQVYRFVPGMGGGVFQDRTLYKGTFELFKFSVKDDKLLFDLLATKTKVSSPFRIEPVTGPKPFDLRLTIENDPRGHHFYYSQRAETDRSGEALDQTLATAAHGK